MKSYFAQLQKIFTKEWILKFISFVMAVSLWSFVGGEEKVDKNVLIPLDVINLPRDLVVSNQFKKDVEVTVNGPRSVIAEISKMSITRSIDLTDSKPGSQVIDITVDSIKMPRGVSVERVQPSSIILSLDKLISKDLSINPVTVGQVAEGYILKKLTIDPDIIQINGPQSQLGRVDVLKTKQINLTGLKTTSQLQVPLDLAPDIVDIIGETSVTANVEVGMKMVSKTIIGLPVEVVKDGVYQTTSPPTVDVSVRLPEVMVAKELSFTTLFAVTVAAGENAERYKVQIVPRAQNTYPIEVIKIEPEYVTLVIKPTIESETHHVEGANVPLINTSKNKIVK